MYDKDVMASNLCGFRASKRMSQAEVAEIIGVSEGTIANYESGRGGMSIENAWALADLYGVSLDDLSGRKMFAQ